MSSFLRLCRRARALNLWLIGLAAALTVGGAVGGLVSYATWPQRSGLHVGFAPLSVPMDALPLRMRGAVWYPASSAAKERPYVYSSSIWGTVAKRATPAKGLAKRPLVILAHGWRGTLYDLSWLAEALVRQGYVVASVAQPDVDASTWDNELGPKVWYRASIMRALIDAVGQDPNLAALTDASHVVAIGHSAGGSAVIMLGGAKLDPDRFASIYPQSAPSVDGAWADPRLAGVIALDPGTGPAFAPEGLKKMQLPILLLSGGQDHVAPEASNAGYYARFFPQAMWRSFAEANHYSFLYECSPWGRLRHFGICQEASRGTNRHAIHEAAFASITAFLRTLDAHSGRRAS